MEFLFFLAAVLEAASRSRLLDPGLLAWLETLPHPLGVAIGVAMLAGASTLLGNSVVLFINRVRGLRFWFSILLNGVALVALYLVQAVVVYLAGLAIVGPGPTLLHTTLAVMLSTGPLVFGVFALFPFVGPWIARVLQAWSFLSLWAMVAVAYDRGIWTGLLISGIGWGVMQLLAWAFAKPITWAGDRIWRLVTGRPSMLTGHDILSGHPFMPVGLELAPEAGRRDG
jgi:hypothetical protein